MDSDRFCPDPDAPGSLAHYEIPPETYCRLQAVALLLDKDATTKPFAVTLRSLFGQIVCVLED
jgi:hypothetical protein